MSKNSCFGALLLVLTATSSVENANILGVFTSHSTSHLIVHMSAMKALAERGHNVTVFSSMETTIKHKNIKHIVIPLTPEESEILSSSISDMANEKLTWYSTIARMFGSLRIMIDKQYEFVKDSRFTWIYKNADTKFDVVYLGAFINTYQLGIAAKLKVPVIVEWTGPPMSLVDGMVGNPHEISYVPNMHLATKQGEPMNFMERLQNFGMNLFFRGLMEVMDYRMATFYERLFGDDETMPNYADVKKNISLVFCNSHGISEGPIRPNVPGLIEIGGIQIKEKPDPLPTDIAKFLDTAKEGAILFSLGSNLKGHYVKPEILKTIFTTLSSLKQKVIWKWDDLQNTPGNSTNIMYKKWLPQDDILAHPSITLFITHAGKGGVAEAQYHGVPMLAFPVFADQPGNAEKIVKSGFGLKLELLTIQQAKLTSAIEEILDNPKYRYNMKKFSKMYRDRPLTSQETVVFWTEYVIRHHGASHLQSPAVHMSFIALYNLDVYALLATMFITTITISIFLVKCICRKICKKSKVKIN